MTDVRAWARTHLAPLGITDDEAIADAASAEFAPARYETAASLNALHRLRAEVQQHPTAIADLAPALPPDDPLVVAADPGDAGTATMRLDGALLVTSWSDLPDVLSQAGVSLTGEKPPSLVIDTPRSLRRMVLAARERVSAPASPVIDYWGQRAEHPGALSILVVSDLLALRWAPPVEPGARISLRAWAAWFALSEGDPAQVCADLMALVTAGAALPGLAEGKPVERAAWGRAQAGKRRVGMDSRREAALGLMSRCDAADLYASLRLSDPLVAEIATRSGEVVPGKIVDYDRERNLLTVAANMPVCRHKKGSELKVWGGLARDPQTIESGAPYTLSGVLHSSVMASGGVLMVTVGDTVVRRGSPADPAIGESVTLREKPIDAKMQMRGRDQRARKYRAGSNWLARMERLPVANRTVPLEVLVAAADDE